jgi:MFS family permease
MPAVAMAVERSRRTYRISVSVLFFLQGICFATWASRIPSIQQQLNISNAKLGAILFSLPAGSMLTLLFSGGLIHRYGSKIMSAVSVLLYGLVLPFIGFADSTWMLVMVLFLFGMTGNLGNISINTQAVHVEARYGRKILASFHGLWSLAGFVAAGAGTIMIGRNVPPSLHFLGVAVIMALTVLILFSYLLPDSPQPSESTTFFVKPDKLLLKLGILASLCMICEGTMFDWSGIYFQKVVLAEKDWIGAGYTAFMCAMATGRFIGDWIANKLQFRDTIFFSALTVTAGLLLSVIFPYVATAVIGFMLVGFGVSSMIPLIYSEAGKSKAVSPGMALTAVSSIGFFGFLLGPPLVGVIAGIFSLRISFLLIAIIGIIIAVMVSNSGSKPVAEKSS